MAMNRKAQRRDENEGEIVKALRAVGASVEFLGGKGVPDLLVGYRCNNYLLEVKRLGESLSDDQSGWHASWLGQVRLVHTPAGALAAIGFEDS